MMAVCTLTSRGPRRHPLALAFDECPEYPVSCLPPRFRSALIAVLLPFAAAGSGSRSGPAVEHGVRERTQASLDERSFVPLTALRKRRPERAEGGGATGQLDGLGTPLLKNNLVWKMEKKKTTAQQLRRTRRTPTTVSRSVYIHI